MRDVRTELERLGDRVRPATDAFERLEQRRRRRARNRRLGAGLLALTLMVGGLVAAFSAVRGDDDEQTLGGVEVDTGFHALWPETTLEDALIVQSQVERGEKAWRTDPAAVAVEFAGSVLGWHDLRLGGFIVSQRQDVDAGVVVMDVQLCREPASPCLPATAEVSLTLSEVVPGVWSVIEVDGAALHTGLPVGAVVADGSALTFPVEAPEGTEVQVGFWYGPPGCASGQDALGVVRDGQVVVDVSLFGDGSCEEGLVPGLDASVDGLLYLAVMEPPSATALGLMTVEPNGNPDVGYLTDLAAVPVLFVPEGFAGSHVPDVARVTCDGANITVDTPVVRAQADGVHLLLNATGGTSLSITEDLGEDAVTDGDTPVSSGQGFGTEPGDSVVLAQIPPGRYFLSCSATPEEGEAGVVGAAPLEVIDPAGYYVPSELECSSGEAYGMGPGYAEGTLGDQGDPVDVARARLTGLEDGDLVERAGYPESGAEPVVRIVRNGIVVGKVQLFDDGQGGWLLSSLEGCGEPSFGWADELTELYPRGWFEWCPDGPFAEPGQDWSERASEAATQFVLAYVNGPEEAFRAVLDASVPSDVEFPISLAEDVVTVFFKSSRGSILVDYSCGRDVDAHTVAITIDDGTESASADFTVFLVLREDGWKVWGVY